MASKWATEKAEALMPRDAEYEATLHPVKLIAWNGLRLNLAEALDAARQEGAREMRERAADIVRDASSSGLLVSVEAAIRALPLEVEA